MAKRVRDGRIREVARWHIDGLHRRAGGVPGRADALLELGELRPQGRLVAHAGGQPPEQTRYLRAGLNEPEDVVDQEEDVLPRVVTEVLGHRQRGVADAESGAGHLVHLAE